MELLIIGRRIVVNSELGPLMVINILRHLNADLGVIRNIKHRDLILHAITSQLANTIGKYLLLCAVHRDGDSHILRLGAGPIIPPSLERHRGDNHHNNSHQEGHDLLQVFPA